MGKVYRSIDELIGATPLLELVHIEEKELSGISTGMATFSWPVALNRASRSFWISSQMAWP